MNVDDDAAVGGVEAWREARHVFLLILMHIKNRCLLQLTASAAASGPVPAPVPAPVPH